MEGMFIVGMAMSEGELTLGRGIISPHPPIFQLS